MRRRPPANVQSQSTFFENGVNRLIDAPKA
jgi:hypothetical protein